ncbi:aryl-alcohol dehydrogenase-like predicted oxidoreductase [Anseongella ginsenosidimutans]|uniref:Aryl-alcohol dehydrogenase-like predicted oxidoreductase n=1 Tax=Anseongella ginsenosidimutans TaxID=496056 RepID=A0A4R3KVB8_9SPHI|nr:aldo/keto reductase [Anseongella ginsenosidimutans]QEC51543.1 aldo/keto reductase [Anseongella ginsenosidimutans]TCS88864.1 aryl-alcohol dehydrogenase-like predicted oxidoreductase [Anseongella ginsenosidimutans]
MEYRQLGKSDLKVSSITFGAWAIGGWMWGGADRREAIKAIHKAADLGITSIDTAPIYGMGTSEEIVGEAVRELSRDKIQLLTKFGLVWEGTSGRLHMKDSPHQGKKYDVYKYAAADSIRKECENSLRRLKTDYIDLYQIHWPDPTTPIDETMDAVAALIREGKVREAGVCNYSAAEMKEAETTLKLVSNQVPYSMVNRGIEAEIVPHCLETGAGILAYSPLQRGVLTGKFQPGHEFKEGDHRPQTPFFKPGNISRINTFLEKIRPIAEDKGATLAQLVLRWTIDQPGITAALAGARDAAQVAQNAKAAEITLNAEELASINGHLAELELKAD